MVTRLQSVRQTLEDLFGDAQDFEFTVEDAKLWVLQTRTAKRTPIAALQIACDLVNQGIIDPATAIERLNGYNLDDIKVVELQGKPGIEPIGRATPASTGVASGRIALDVDTAVHRSRAGEPVILVRGSASTDDIAALEVCKGLLNASGARTSHAAVVARQLGVVCLVSCSGLDIDVTNRKLRIGDQPAQRIPDCHAGRPSGLIYPAELRLVERRPTQLIEQVRAWQSGQRPR